MTRVMSLINLDDVGGGVQAASSERERVQLD